MRKFYRLRLAFLTTLVLILNIVPAPANAVSQPPVLTMREVKITGDEFVVLRANQDISDLSSFWLGYSSLDSATNIVPTEQLPAIALQAGQAVLLTSDGVQTCDAVYSAKLVPSLSDTKGALEIRQLTNTDASTSTFVTIDNVNWSKPSSSGSTTDNLDLRQEAGNVTPVWYHDPGNYAAPWLVGDFQGCSLTAHALGLAAAQTYTWPAASTGPPATIVSTASDTSSASNTGIPADDIGLPVPQLSELLPNPSGTGTDSSDEFIELYNSGSSSFDLSGFVLQTGTTTKRSYAFPAGTLMPAKAFVAFYSADTGLSLSNTNGAADLLDPLGNVIGQTDPYSTAKDGTAWALAKGKWYWTSQPTPGAANVINQSASSTTSFKAKTSSGSVKGAATAKVGTSTGTIQANNDALAVTPIHPWTLAAVALFAVAYGIYEYRLDLANRFYQLRRHYRDRRQNRQSV